MPTAHHRAPQALADLKFLSVDDAPVAVRQRVHGLAEAPEARLVVLERLVVPTGAAIEAHAVRGRFAPGIGYQHTTRHVLQSRGPQPAVVLPRQPAGHAGVIGMQW